MPGTLVIDPGVAYLTGVAHRLALSLATLVVDQTLLSESDVPFEPFTAAFAINRRVTATGFRDAIGFDSTRHVDLGAASGFFLFGRLSGGPLVGLRSIAIET